MTGIVSIPRPKLDAAHYRRRARESRDLAPQLPDEVLRQQMLEIADGYDRIAARAEAWERQHQTG
jgi:hypothetical protein